MYRHLLVPVDGTDLSTETVGQAVELARVLNARITFFHAVEDAQASVYGTAEIIRATAASEYEYAFVGRAREILAKAEAAARALGVLCATRHAVSDSPHEAIIAAAREAGCDLIFMASHGRRTQIGMLLGSETVKVLVHCGIPLLVAATEDPAAPAHAIGIIRDEHRSLAAVLHASLHHLEHVRRTGTATDSTLMRAVVHYIRAFPVKLHHPKEDDYLFPKLRERAPQFASELDELERQHERDGQLVAELEGIVERAAAGAADIAELQAAVERYAAFIWNHLGREEGLILPAAHRHLTTDDWREVDAAFAENRDPRFGGDTDREYRRLFSRIVNLAKGQGPA